MYFSAFRKNAEGGRRFALPLSKAKECADMVYGIDILEESIRTLDAELYEKYELTTEEIAFIEAMIKPME